MNRGEMCDFHEKSPKALAGYGKGEFATQILSRFRDFVTQKLGAASFAAHRVQRLQKERARNNFSGAIDGRPILAYYCRKRRQRKAESRQFSRLGLVGG